MEAVQFWMISSATELKSQTTSPLICHRAHSVICLKAFVIQYNDDFIRQNPSYFSFKTYIICPVTSHYLHIVHIYLW